jgi:hypothetical protein
MRSSDWNAHIHDIHDIPPPAEDPPIDDPHQYIQIGMPIFMIFLLLLKTHQ